ncbi:hypothetical protein KW114_12580 [Methylococcus capsulatus]|jgi:hypothetical protein|uniref:Lipoprotein n=2 Tax=Methylococcaceae TaxID=403 RepID=A0AA35UYA4_METCP|nr:hypothetical protein KW112_06395 [Methylococcus capsulatus]QXP89898.1 hypothetical protein KW114_12580 [Methylococcus capsulatus]QXP94239.1 hypothetical protein KW113_03240 [Methylococcus capsulatus]CAI8765069.1 conserved exported protein of unknown function [Methylococcus capsulatus]
MKPLHMLFSLLGLSACAMDTFTTGVPVDELEKVSGEKPAHHARNVDGVDIWTTGAPDRKYKILGMIHDVRRNVPWRTRTYLSDLAQATKKAGGDAAIIIIADSKLVYKMGMGCDASVETTEKCIHAQGASLSGAAPGEEATIYSENIESTSVPLEYKDSRVLVIKYLDTK